ncbi:MAG: DUF4038 domain-containing protein [Acidobacteria bacterium]|nr:DUF4038 domain-containing protein [Acidobacteriota bacterium]
MNVKLLPTALIVLFILTILAGAPAAEVPMFSLHEVTFRAEVTYSNPYTELFADATLTEPDGKTTRTMPLFWDGGATWKLRFAPDKPGKWQWAVKSADGGLKGKTGTFTAVRSSRKGGIRPMSGFPRHFERQDGSRLWFMGDTAWAFFHDSPEEKYDGAAARRYLDARAAQGFNVIHCMMLSEAGDGNSGGKPWTDLSAEKMNHGYWQQVDQRIAYANNKGIVVGLAVAWADKRKQEPFAWRMFPSLEARKRYASYVAARYGAYDVYFLVSGEWHGEVRTRPSTESEMKKEFIEIGNALSAANAQGRMIGIHPMTRHGSTREFNDASWMSFGDYQQNYHDLHGRALESRRFNKPVVNSEYGYHLRDQNGDGTPDKDNSTSLAAIRNATWDIVMAGAYVVTGFGTTYFGGHRDPGPFDLDASKNKDWERQIGLIQRLFTGMEYWKLEPHDELIRCNTPRGTEAKEFKRTIPPPATYWCLAQPGKQYVLYVRGLSDSMELTLGGGNYTARQFNPRTGEFTALSKPNGAAPFYYRPPDQQDWVVLLEEGKLK